MAELTSGPIFSFLPEADTPPIFMLTVIPPVGVFLAVLVGGVKGFFSGVVVSDMVFFAESRLFCRGDFPLGDKPSLVILFTDFSVDDVVLFGVVVLLLAFTVFSFSFFDVLLFSVFSVLPPSFMVEVTFAVVVGLESCCFVGFTSSFKDFGVGVESFFLASILAFSVEESGCVFFSNLFVDFGENLLAGGDSLLAFCLKMAIFSAMLVGPAAALVEREDLGESTFDDPATPCDWSPLRWNLEDTSLAGELLLDESLLACPLSNFEANLDVESERSDEEDDDLMEQSLSDRSLFVEDLFESVDLSLSDRSNLDASFDVDSERSEFDLSGRSVLDSGLSSFDDSLDVDSERSALDSGLSSFEDNLEVDSERREFVFPTRSESAFVGFPSTDLSLSDRSNFEANFDVDSERSAFADFSGRSAEESGLLDSTDLSLSDRSNFEAIRDADSDRSDGEAVRNLDGESLRSGVCGRSNLEILSFALPPEGSNRFFFLSDREERFGSLLILPADISSILLMLMAGEDSLPLSLFSFMVVDKADILSFLSFFTISIFFSSTFFFSLFVGADTFSSFSGFLAVGGDFLAGLGATLGSVLIFTSSVAGSGASDFNSSGSGSISISGVVGSTSGVIGLISGISGSTADFSGSTADFSGSGSGSDSGCDSTCSGSFSGSGDFVFSSCSTPSSSSS